MNNINSTSGLLGIKAKNITPYVAGEQPRDKAYIKLNTNECPYPPSPAVLSVLKNYDYATLSAYPDPTSDDLKNAVASYYGMNKSNVFAGGGSDEVLGLAFATFANKGDNVYFPDVTYGFYSVYADLFSLNAVTIPLEDDFTIDIDKYKYLDGNIFIANPNAPTGISLSLFEIEEIVSANPNNLVVIDEAYIDFSSEQSAITLVEKYANLLVVQTFSKSRSLAGMRLGFGFAHPSIIDGLERIKFSFNPYNIDLVSTCVGTASVNDADYLSKTCEKIIATRTYFTTALERLSFRVLPSKANFVFATHKSIPAIEIFQYLRDNGVLVRYFSAPRIDNYLRISIGTDTDMHTVIQILSQLINK